MESDQSSPENLDQVTAAEQGASHGRSYDCTFCKRGFSNAQALGGHMNMHRRQKPKLKPFPSEYQAASDIPRVIPSDPPIPENPSWPLGANSSDERRTIKWPWISSQHGYANTRDETRVGEGYKLPLFVETPSDKDQAPGSHPQEKTEKGLASTSGDESGSQIDLVLRLGPGPQVPSAETGTKKFF